MARRCRREGAGRVLTNVERNRALRAFTVKASLGRRGAVADADRPRSCALGRQTCRACEQVTPFGDACRSPRRRPVVGERSVSVAVHLQQARTAARTATSPSDCSRMGSRGRCFVKMHKQAPPSGCPAHAVSATPAVPRRAVRSDLTGRSRRTWIVGTSVFVGQDLIVSTTTRPCHPETGRRNSACVARHASRSFTSSSMTLPSRQPFVDSRLAHRVDGGITRWRIAVHVVGSVAAWNTSPFAATHRYRITGIRRG